MLVAGVGQTFSNAVDGSLVLAIPVAFAAGLVSFLAPCVLPLVPGYLSAVSAVDPARLAERSASRQVVVSSIPFVLGFTAVFVALGTGVAAAGGLLSTTSQQEIA